MKWLSSLRRQASDAADAGESGPPPPALEAALGAIDFPVPSAAESVREVPDRAPGEANEPVVSSPTGLQGEPPPGDPPPALADAATRITGGVSWSAALSLERLEALVAAQAQTLETLARRQEELGGQFATKIRSDEAQARAVETLHDELRQHKANFIRQQLLPVLKEVIFCHDFLTGLIDGRAAAGDGTAALEKGLSAARQMLADLLYKYDVESYRCEGPAFDPQAQQCTQTVPTGDAAADRAIAGRGLEGFRGPEGIVRREQVSVFKFTPGAL